jgi:hypothetical protein
VNEVYEKIRPANMDEMIKGNAFDENWEQNSNQKSYENICNLMYELLKFAKVFYDVKSEHIFKLGKYLY